MPSAPLFDALNHTELYQIARRAGHTVHPRMPRETLIEILLGDIEPNEADENPIDAWRLAIMRFVIEHKSALASQLKCPAKTLDPRACFGCLDSQVLNCLAQNEQHLSLITPHRKPGR